MEYRNFVAMLLGSAAIVGCGTAATNQAMTTNEAQPSGAAAGFILEGYPTAVAESLDRHNRRLEEAAEVAAHGNQAMSSVIVQRQSRWTAGTVVRVAFRGGDSTLYARIEQMAQQWTQPGLANVTLSFRDEAGRYRQWSPQDSNYAGEIRIGFIGGREGGYWSHVGLDSIDRTILGGAPGQQPRPPARPLHLAVGSPQPLGAPQGGP